MFNMNLSEVFSNFESPLLEKSRNMDKITDVDAPIAMCVEVSDNGIIQSELNDLPKSLEPCTTYEIDGDIYETDSNGEIYKKNGELIPNTEYTINGITYKTDENGRIISWEGTPGYNPDADRDTEAQTDAGGEDRKDGDDGGHLVARVLDGSPGNENIVPMRDTVNRGDYKRSENEIANAKKNGKDVQDSGYIIYEGDSSRPSKIERTYFIDGQKRELKVDNVEGSKDLLEDVKSDISEEDYESLEERISDMEADGSDVSVTSVYKKYDADGNLESVTVGIRDETNGTKTYIKYDAK